MAEPGSAPWKGLTIGGLVAAGVVLIGLWFNGFFDPLGQVQDAIDADAAAVASDHQAAPVTQAEETTAETSSDTTAPAAGDSAALTAPATDTSAASIADATPPEAKTDDTPSVADSDPSAGAQTAETAEITSATDTPTPPQTPATPVDPDADVPGFDVVRTETDGSSLIAGRAAPGARVEVLVDGQVMGTETVGSDGKFAAFVDLPASTAPRTLTLRTSGADGDVTSTEEVIVGPTSSPDAVASDGDTGTGGDAAAPTVLLSDADGVKVLQSGAGAPTEEVSLGAVSYAADGAVTLSGTGTPGSFVRIYVDGVVSRLVKIAAGGVWTALVPEINAGNHLLRIDEIAEDGSVVSRVETEFTREVGDVMADAGPEATSDSSASGSTTAASAETSGEAAADGAPVVASAEVIVAEDPAPTTADPAVDTGGDTGGDTDSAGDGAVIAPADSQTAETAATAAADQAPTDGQTAQTDAQIAQTSEAETSAAPISTAETTEAPETPTAPREIVVTMVDGTTAGTDGAAPSTTRVTVVKGATLWAIAREKYGEGVLYVRVYDANRNLIRNPDLIYPGQVFDLPN